MVEYGAIFKIFAIKNGVTLKPELVVTQGRWKWYPCLPRIRLPNSAQ